MWQLVSGKMMLDAGMTSQFQPRFYSLRIASPIGQCRSKTTTETSFTRGPFQTHLLNHIKMACSASGFKYSKGSRTGLEFDSFISGSFKRKDTIQIENISIIKLSDNEQTVLFLQVVDLIYVITSK